MNKGKGEKMEKKQKLEIDIELKDLFWEFLRKWRIIVCSMLVGGILLGALAYIADYKNASVAIIPSVEMEKTVEDVIAELNIDELEEVIAAVQLKAQIDGKSQYISESILMAMNAFAEDRVVLEYSVSGDSAATALSYYQSWIKNAGYLGEEKNVYISELVTAVGDSEINTLTVQILHENATACAELAQEVANALTQYAASLESDGISHEIKLVQQTQSVVVDDALHKYQDAYLKENIADQTSLAKMKSDMNGNQVTAYLHMEREVFDRGEVKTEEEVKEETPVVTENAKVSIDLKQILLGMIVGAVLAVVYIFLAYIMTGKLRTAKEIELLYDTKLLGSISDRTTKKTKFAAVDNLIWKLEHCKSKKLSFEQEVELAAASVRIQCQKYNLHEVYVSSSKMEAISEKVLEALKNELAKHDIKLYRGGDLNASAEALLAAANVGAVLFIEKKREAAYKNILKCMQTCGTNDLQVLGMIVTEE